MAAVSSMVELITFRSGQVEPRLEVGSASSNRSPTAPMPAPDRPVERPGSYAPAGPSLGEDGVVATGPVAGGAACSGIVGRHASCRSALSGFARLTPKVQ